MIRGLDGIPIRFALVEAFTYVGIHSGEELRGHKVELVSFSKEGNDRIEALLKGEGPMLVDEPTTGEQYEARASGGWSSSHQTGQPSRTYFFTIQEIDRPMPFSQLQIVGETFTVLRSGQTEENSRIIIDVLLRLNPDEFATLLGLLRSGPISTLRVGVDDTAVERRFGGLILWSSHEDDSGTYHKLVLSLPEADEPVKRRAIASAQQQDALADMVKGLTARHEALVDMLHFNGSISQEQASELKQEQWRGLVGEQRAREIWAQTRKVDDAEEYFEHYAKNEPRP